MGRACNSRATAPEVTAVAWEVPLPRKKRSSTTADGCSTSMVAPGARKLANETPGATTSTLRSELPMLENGATVSSRAEAVLWRSAAPTAMT